MNNPYNVTPATIVRRYENELKRLEAMIPSPKLTIQVDTVQRQLDAANVNFNAWQATMKVREQ